MTAISFPELDEVSGKLNERRKSLKTIFDEAGPTRDMALVKSIDGDTNAKVEQIRSINAEIDELGVKQGELLTIKAGLEQAGRYSENTASGDNSPSTKGLSRQLADVISTGVKTDSVKRFRKIDDDFNAREFLGLKTLMTTAAGWAPDVVRGPRMIDLATAPIALLDFIPTTTTNQTSVAYMQETTRTNAAAERDEGAAKVESTLVLTEASSPVRSIATSLGVTDEQLEDVDRIDAYINQRLPMFLRERLELQVLVGDGTAPNISGILDQAIQTQAKGADPVPDAIYKAMTKVRVTGEAEPDAVVMHPNDWQDVRLLRTADGIYIWGSPADAGPNRIWGLPVILAQRLTENTAIVGAFKMFTEIAVKKGITVDRGFINDDFTKDITRLRAEIRAAFILYRLAAMCSVTGI